VYRDAFGFVIVALDDRERSFDVVLGPLGVAERPDPAAGRSLRELLARAGQDPPPFSFDSDRLEADLEQWAEALRRHGPA